MNTIDIVLTDVKTEVREAREKHDAMTNRHQAYRILLEEVDEFWSEVKKNPSKMAQVEIDMWKEHMREELIQVAAMAVRAIIDLNL